MKLKSPIRSAIKDETEISVVYGFCFVLKLRPNKIPHLVKYLKGYDGEKSICAHI